MNAKRLQLTSATVAAALLSALQLAQPAQAGLLGGSAGGGLGGQIGGGLSGNVGGTLGARPLDARSSAAGQAQPDLAVRRTGQVAPQVAPQADAQGQAAATAARTRTEGTTSGSAQSGVPKKLSPEQRLGSIDAGSAAAAQATPGSRSIDASGSVQTSVQR